MSYSRINSPIVRTLLAIAVIMLLITLQPANSYAATSCDEFIPGYLADGTALAPLTNPPPATYNPRYISGIGMENNFRIFFENRFGAPGDDRIWYNSTTTGPTGFLPASTPTIIEFDGHFLIKEWPYTHESTLYDFRAWSANGLDGNHNFYVSNDLTNWILVSTFTIPIDAGFTTARGTVKYGFHDAMLINGTYYAWAEASNATVDSFETMIVSSPTGADDWVAIDKVGGDLLADGPLATMAEGDFMTATGSFFVLGTDCGYGKIQVHGDNSGLYLAVNTVAKPSQVPAVLEANFINPANWTWSDGSTGRLTAGLALISSTSEHDFREAWKVPSSSSPNRWLIMYSADYDGTSGLGYAFSPGTCEPWFSCIYMPVAVK